MKTSEIFSHFPVGLTLRFGGVLAARTIQRAYPMWESKQLEVTQNEASRGACGDHYQGLLPLKETDERPIASLCTSSLEVPGAPKLADREETG